MVRMSDVERPMDFHAQDWIVIIDALARWAGAPGDDWDRRSERAYKLIDSLEAWGKRHFEPAESV